MQFSFPFLIFELSETANMPVKIPGLSQFLNPVGTLYVKVVHTMVHTH